MVSRSERQLVKRHAAISHAYALVRLRCWLSFSSWATKEPRSALLMYSAICNLRRGTAILLTKVPEELLDGAHLGKGSLQAVLAHGRTQRNVILQTSVGHQQLWSGNCYTRGQYRHQVFMNSMTYWDSSCMTCERGISSSILGGSECTSCIQLRGIDTMISREKRATSTWNCRLQKGHIYICKIIFLWGFSNEGDVELAGGCGQEQYLDLV